MFLIRTAFWLSLVILVLPTDEQQQARLFKTIEHTAGRVSTFCERNEKTCANGADWWGRFKEKAAFGGEVATKLFYRHVLGAEQPSPAETASVRRAAPAAPVPVGRAQVVPVHRQTLAPLTLQPPQPRPARQAAPVQEHRDRDRGLARDHDRATLKPSDRDIAWSFGRD
ncbi:MAG: hypothetical protein AAFR04_01595 [Pseudomonadota bacterium]